MTNLPPADLDLFFKLYPALHLYVNEQVHVLPNVRTLDELKRVSMEDRIKLRDALYDQPDLLDRFMAENPAGLTAEELTEVKSWSRFIRGDFYVVRHLKRYSVFLSSGQPARAYGVLGLSNSISDMFPSYSLPVYLRTVLLPFKGHIVWDGLVDYYNLTFGPGIRADLNETYQRVKRREGIVESLTSSGEMTATTAAASRPRKASPDLGPIVRRIAEESEELRPGATPIQSRVYAFLRAAAHLAETATNDPSDLRAIDEQMRAVTRSYKQLATIYAREVDGDYK